MQATRKAALGLTTLTALGLAAVLPQAAHAQTVLDFTSGTYSAQDLANDGTVGTDFDMLNLASQPGIVGLFPGVTSTAAINGLTFTEGTSSSTVPFTQSFVGSEDFTLDGVTKPLTFDYTVTSNAFGTPDYLHFLSSAPTVFDLGSVGSVSVAVPDQFFESSGVTQGVLSATFTLTAAPEPSSVAGLGLGVLGMAGLILTARRRKTLAA